jgi:hypothetical protein
MGSGDTLVLGLVEHSIKEDFHHNENYPKTKKQYLEKYFGLYLIG